MNGNSAPRAQSESNGQAATAEVTITSVTVAMDWRGALYWPEERVLVIADLHLEKGSSFAGRGVLLPPYDTVESLARIAGVIARFAPRVVIALGDSFHDKKGSARIDSADRSALVELQRGRDWIWIAGNHDPAPVDGLGGASAAMVAIGPLCFRHLPLAGAVEGEICGHLHPVARVNGRGRTVSRRCFATDGKRLVMPAFGAYAGGLNVRDRAFAEVFQSLAFTAHLLGEGRLYAIAGRRCLRD